MKAAVFLKPGRIAIQERPIPDVGPLVTHRFRLDQIEAAYELFSQQRHGVSKVAITP